MAASYFFNPEQNKALKIETDPSGKTWTYHVQVKKYFDTGSFIHARGRDAVASVKMAEQLAEVMGAQPSTEEKYVSMLIDYFAIDKKIREQFIETYKL